MATVVIKIQDNLPKLKNFVQMDESLFTHSEFDPLHPLTLTQRKIWIYGIIEEGTGNLRVYMMKKPNARLITEILATVVEPYTVVHSDAHPM